MPSTRSAEGGIDRLQSLVAEHPDAQVIQSDAEAIAVAHRLAAQFAVGAAERDRNRRLPHAELDEFSQSGLWAITVPREYGGADVSIATLCKVVAIIAAADPSISQISQNHYCLVKDLGRAGTDEQKRFFFGRILKGDRTGNAFAEPKGKTVAEMQTKITPSADGNSLFSLSILMGRLSSL
jgi:alkylation response protein AidB-like acyl-CoA dehydrogenase